MRITYNAMEKMLTNERTECCDWCHSGFAYLLDDMLVRRSRRWFLFFSTGKCDRDFFVKCPVCGERLYLTHVLNRKEYEYLVKKDQKVLEAERLARPGCGGEF